MSFDLGRFAEQLQCDMCSSDPTIDLNVPSNSYDDGLGLPDDFWDEPPEPPDTDFELPDFYPTFEFTDDGFIIGIHGTM